MKTVIKIFVLSTSLFTIFFSLSAFSWEEGALKSAEDLQKRFFDKRKKISEEFKSLKLKAEMFDGLEEKLESLMDGFGKKFFDNFFEDDFFKDDFFKGMDSFGGIKKRATGKWKESEDKMTFILNVESKKGVPLNIEIKNGIIKIAGDVIQKNEKVDKQGNKKFSSQRVMRIRQSYSIPKGLDEKNPLVKEERGKIKIIFKKLKNYRPKKKKPARKNPQNLKPLDPSLFDKTI